MCLPDRNLCSSYHCWQSQYVGQVQPLIVVASFQGLLTPLQRLSLAVLLPRSQAFSPSVGRLQCYCLVPRPSHPALVTCSTTASFPGLLTPAFVTCSTTASFPGLLTPAFVTCSTTASFPGLLTPVFVACRSIASDKCNFPLHCTLTDASECNY